MTTEEQFKSLALRLGDDAPMWWHGGPLHYTFKNVMNAADVIHDEKSGQCRLEAALEFYRPARDPEYSKWMERCLYGPGPDMSEAKLSACSNIFYRKRFREEFPEARARGCDVEDVHVHGESGNEHVHIACRRDMACLDAFKIAPVLIRASSRLHREKR